MDLHSAAISCRSIRREFGVLFSSLSSEISFRKNGNQVFFLRDHLFGGNSLFSRDIDGQSGTVKMILNPDGARKLSQSEQLLRERMRATGSGITYYKYIESIDSLLVNTGPGCCLVPCQGENILYFPCKEGAAIDYKLCPQDCNVLGCISDGDIYLLSANCNDPLQLTNTCGERPLRKVTAGQSSFILQEEFDRYTGYWWAPDSGKNSVFRILYEEVDETAVETVNTFNPSTQQLDTYSYPRPGSVNAVSTLKLVCFKLSNEKIIEKTTNELPKQINDYLKEWEYLVRIGWTDDSENIWMLLMNREQTKSQIILINTKAFEGRGDFPLPVVLWEETSTVWINYFNVEYIKFLQPTVTCSTRLLITSETSGYPHIVLLEGKLPSSQLFSLSNPFKPVMADLNSRYVTQGKWNVLSSDVWVDDEKNLVYFRGNKSSCLDSHLYVVNLNGELPCTDPIQLTPDGFYHSSISLDPNTKLFATNCSNQTTPPSVSVYSIDTASLETKRLFPLNNPSSMPTSYTPPTKFVTTAATGETLHGVVYPPINLQEGEQYRTIVYVYGGPAIQLVTNSFSHIVMKVSQWTHNGFAVVVLDNRGSANRGTKFESYIQGKMGSVEVDDQVAGLEAAAKIAPYIDLKRVGICGWSYGGYMSLLALAKRPECFKVAIAGAPVTDWLWYDTGYTERYLGIPPAAKSVYENSSIIPIAMNFPSIPGRLLILHGMSDENVFFTHTSLLIDALVRHKKPYQLQMYNGERHGLRSPDASSHCDATVLTFLQENL